MSSPKPHRFRLFCNVPLPSNNVKEDKLSIIENGSSINSNENVIQGTDEDPMDPDFICPSKDSEVDCVMTELTDEVECENKNDELVEQEDIIPATINIPVESVESEETEEQLPKGTEKNSTLGCFKNDGSIRKGKKQKDFCKYCENFVLNFARHIQRNHSSELEVQRVISQLPGSKTRKKLLTLIRNNGNYLISSKLTKPVRNTTNEVIPCSNCYGFFSKNQLWRHHIKCTGHKGRAQSKSQNLLTQHLQIDQKLKDTVFPRMRPDNISLNAKKDKLICAFAARYIKIHREDHFVLVATRKMRELAKLVMEANQQNTNIKCLLDLLKPEHFDTILSAVKIVANYDKEKDIYRAPSYALNMGATLKQCCELAILLLIKRKKEFGNISAANREADLRSVIHLIESQWRFEISNQAANDLNVNKWNKITIVPLATDLKLFKNYLNEQALLISEKLNTNPIRKDYISLLENVYCRVLLLNRRRPGELQRLRLHVYKISDIPSNSYEEFNEVVTPTEQILLKKFKRVVVRGKRGRGVPVLFSPDVQAHIELLLRYRSLFSKKPNLYLFGNPSSSEPIYGYQVLKKIVKMSGVKNPEAITATRLRKHLATLAQLFSMTDNDLEQLSSFMGHTKGIHRDNYRLPDDVYQTAKISKILLLMEEGRAADFKGKNFDEIDLNLDDNLLENKKSPTSAILENKKNVIDNKNDMNDIELFEDHSDKEQDEEKESPKMKKGKRILTPWTEEQKAKVKHFFKDHIKKKIPPKKGECLELIEANKELLRNKDWLKIKVFVQNQYVKNK